MVPDEPLEDESLVEGVELLGVLEPREPRIPVVLREQHGLHHRVHTFMSSWYDALLRCVRVVSLLELANHLPLVYLVRANFLQASLVTLQGRIEHI